MTDIYLTISLFYTQRRWHTSEETYICTVHCFENCQSEYEGQTDKAWVCGCIGQLSALQQHCRCHSALCINFAQHSPGVKVWTPIRISVLTSLVTCTFKRHCVLTSVLKLKRTVSGKNNYIILILGVRNPAVFSIMDLRIVSTSDVYH